MLGLKMRFSLTKDVIEYSEVYDEHQKLFDEGISVLDNRIRTDDFSEFSDEEREVLEEIFTIIHS